MSKFKSSTLKSILTTASVAAVMLGSSSAMAADISTNVGNGFADTNTAGDWDPATAPVAGDNIILTSHMTDINLNSGKNTAFGTFSFNNLGGLVNRSLGIADTYSYSFTDMVNLGATTTVNANFMAAGSLTIGNTRAAISDVQFINADGTLTVTTGNIAHDVTGTDGENIGTLNINGATTVGGKIGNGAANPIKQVNVANGAELRVTGASNVTSISITGTGSYIANGSVTADNVAFVSSNALLSLAAGQTLNITTGTTGAGAITTGGNVTLIGNYGALTDGASGANTLSHVQFAGKVTLGSGGNGAKIVADHIYAGGPDSLIIAENSRITTTGAEGIDAFFSIVINNERTLTLGDGTVVNGTINAANASNGTLVFAAPLPAELEGPTPPLLGSSIGDVVGGIKALSSVVVDQGARVAINSNVTATNTFLNGVVNLASTYKSNITLGSSGKLYSNAGSGITGNINFAGEGGYVYLNSSAITINGNINGDTANGNTGGNLAVVGAPNGSEGNVATVTGNIGENGAISNIYIGYTAGDEVDLALTRATLVTQNVEAKNIHFAGGKSTLNVTNWGAISVLDGTTGTGNILAGSLVTFAGKFGSLTDGLSGENSLRSITLQGNTTLGNGVSGVSIVASDLIINEENTTIAVAQNSSITVRSEGGIGSNGNFLIFEDKVLTLGDGTGVYGRIDGAESNWGTLVIGGSTTEGDPNGVYLMGEVGGVNPLSAISIGNYGLLVAEANISATNGVTFLGSGTFNLGTNTLNGNLNLTTGSELIVTEDGNVTGAITNDGDGIGIVTRTGGNIQAIGEAGSRLLLINLDGNVTVDQNIFSNAISIRGGTTTVDANIGSNAENGTTAIYLEDGASLSINAGKQIFGFVSGMGNASLSISGDPSTSVIGNITIEGNIFLGGDGSITRNVISGGLTTVNSEVTIANGSNFSAQCVCIAGGTLTVEEGANFTATDDTTGVYGGGTLALKQGGALPQLGNSGGGAGLNAVLLNPITAKSYQASGTYKVTSFTIGSNANLDTSASGLNLNGGLVVNDGGTLTLGSSALTVSGVTQVLGAATIKTTADINGNIGNIASTGGTQIAGKNITLVITNDTVLPSGTKTLFTNIDGVANVTIESKGLNTFAYNKAEGTITIGSTAPAPAPSSASAPTLRPATISSATFEGADLQGAIISSSDLSHAEFSAATGMVEEMVSDIISSQSSSAVSATSQNVSSRLSIYVPSTSSGSSKTSKSGKSSGEEDGKELGVWTEVFGSKVKQDIKGELPEYKATSYGAIVGVDTRISESNVIGAAIVFADSKMKSNIKEFSRKIRSKSALISLYGMHDFGNNWFANTIGTFGNTWISSKNKKTTNGVTENSTNKYSASFGSLEVGAEYRYTHTNGITLIPEARVRGFVFKNQKYKEKGATSPKTVNSTYGANFEAIFGGTVVKVFDYKNHEITPSIHGKIAQFLGGKKSKTTIKIAGQSPLEATSQPRNKTVFNLGGDLNIKSNRLEYGVGYDIDLANKYMAQTGSLKLRVNL